MGTVIHSSDINWNNCIYVTVRQKLNDSKLFIVNRKFWSVLYLRLQSSLFLTTVMLGNFQHHLQRCDNSHHWVDNHLFHLNTMHRQKLLRCSQWMRVLKTLLLLVKDDLMVLCNGLTALIKMILKFSRVEHCYSPQTCSGGSRIF